MYVTDAIDITSWVYTTEHPQNCQYCKEVEENPGNCYVKVAWNIRTLNTELSCLDGNQWKQVLSASQTCLHMINIAFARGGAHLTIAHALRLLSTQDEIEIEKK